MDRQSSNNPEAQSLYRILDLLPAALYVTDAEGRLTYFNQAAVEFSGRTPRLGSDQWCVTWRLYYADGRPMAHDECPMATSLKEGRPVRGVTAIAERPDGQRIPFMPYPTPLIDQTGKVVGGINMLLDIRDQVLAEQTASESKHRYSALAELLPVGMYTCKAPNGEITFYNQQAARLWGREPNTNDTGERFCGSWKLWRLDGSRLLHEETPMALALQEGRAFRNQEVIMERPDGSRATVLVNIDAIRDDKGDVIEAINVFHDISEQKRASELRAGLAAIVDSTDDAVVGKTLDGIIQSWNRGAESIFGYTAAEAIGQHITLIIPSDRRAEEDEVLAKLRRGEKITHFETIRRRKNGELIHISLSVSPIRDETGRIIGASKIARDITERKRMEAELEKAYQRKDEFIATLAHELRNPLAPLLSGLQILRMPQGESTRTETLDRMHRQTLQLVRLIDDLLDVSRISSGKLVLQRKRVSLREVIDCAIDTVLPNAKAKKQEISVALPAEQIFLNADDARLCQLLANLLNNSVKYSADEQPIKLIASRQDKEVTLTVADEGKGIPSEFLTKIFEPFSQLPSSQTPNSGLGVGLSIVKRLAELHGGSVHAYSEGLGKGSRFVVRLPIVDDAPPKHSGDSTQMVGKQRRIVVVDDNRDAADSLGTLLGLLGHEVHVQYDGMLGIEAIQRTHPDVVLLDIGMPNIDGYEVCRRIKQGTFDPPPRVLALTGWGQEADRKKASEAGFDAHLVKPVEVRTLVRLLNEYTTEQKQT